MSLPFSSRSVNRLVPEEKIEVRIVVLVLPESWRNSGLHTCVLRTLSVAEFRTV